MGFANKQGRGDILKGIYEAVQYPFGMENQEFRKCCLIRKKEPKKKYVPFDLNNPEDRKALMGKTIKANNRPFSRQYVEFTISCFELVDEGAEGVGGYGW